MAHENPRKAACDGVGVRGLREANLLEQTPRADEGHRQVHLLALVVDRVALHGRGALGRGIVHGTTEQRERDALPTMTWTHAEAPVRPLRPVVDVRDLRRALEGQL